LAKRLNTQRSHNHLGLYVHIPFCRKKCRYCAFYSVVPEPRLVSQFLQAAQQELALHDSLPCVTSVYIGGGSPSCLPTPALVELIQHLTNRCPQSRELTVECNPGQTNETKLAQLYQAGVTRLSIGAQSFHQQELELLGRGHSVACIQKTVADAQKVGFGNIALDLISAIPNATLHSWKHSLRCAVDLGVQHISAYGLSIEKGTDLDRRIRLKQVTPLDEDTDRALYEFTIDFLEEHQFPQYEISNFARKGYECQHNLGYWRNQPFLGIGPAAASYWQGQRSTNMADVREYIKRISEQADACQERHVVTLSDRTCETAVLNLRMRQGIDLRRFQQITGQDALQVFDHAIESQRGLGLLDAQDQHLCLTRRALPIADSVLCHFSMI
jgi:oxygen-independent coproporphyrinogen III oxidase